MTIFIFCRKDKNMECCLFELEFEYLISENAIQNTDIDSIFSIFLKHVLFCYEQLGKMNNTAKSFFLFIFFIVDIRCVHGIHAVGDEEYKALLDLSKGIFSVPVKSRTRIQKSAVVKFWRSNGRFTAEGNILFYEGKKVL